MASQERVDRAERVIPAEPSAIYSGLVDAQALSSWLPPENMTGRIDDFDPRVGGGFRMVLSYPPEALDEPDQGGPGKTTDLEDVVNVTFTALEPGSKVEWQATFDAPDPAFAGVMTQTWTFAPLGGGVTRAVIEARDVPEGISAADHEVGLYTSLAQLDAWVASSSN